MTISLKDVNRPMLALVVIANAILYYAILTSAYDAVSLSGHVADYENFIPGGLIALIVGVLNSQLGHATKARLVFWRWQNPLPGSYAFTKVLPTDNRIDPNSLLTFSNPLPEQPDEQNRLWFKWYREYQEEPSIKQVHREYLLTRDWTGLAFLFLLFLVPLSLWQMEPTQSAILGGVLAAQYLLLRRSAKNHGERFVASVLANKSASS